MNTANPRPQIGSGTDGAIYAAAGEAALLEARRQIGDIAPGQAAHTDAFALDARYIIHTVGPAWTDGEHGEREILHSCYANSLSTAAELGCKSVAFPLIATGVYGFPKDEALQIALGEINRFLLTHDMDVILVVFDRKAFELSSRLVGDIEEYIDEHGASRIRRAEYGRGYERERRIAGTRYPEPETVRGELPVVTGGRRDRVDGASTTADIAAVVPDAAALPQAPDMSGKRLEEVLSHTGETFQQCLLRLIDERGLEDTAVYKKANIDRKLFSKIRCKADYKPRKKTAVAFAIALELDMPTTRDLLAKAEIALSPSSKFDLIITYFITNHKYDIYEINAALFDYGQPMLGE